MRGARFLKAALVLAALVVWPAASAASMRYDPRLRFSTISTARFDIHFHQGEERLARRLAGFVEAAAAEVDAAVGAAVGRVQIILVDQHDLSNGWATPLPYNTIEISAVPPSAESGIGNAADWLRLVFVHEYTHIAHLSQAGGWINGLRRGFGRMPLLFPNLYQPVWAIEGVATFQESRVTGEGRVTAGDFRLLLDTASASSHFEPVDRVNGGNVDWPGGTGSYLYGAYFHDFLARKYGPESIRTLTEQTGRRLPYFGSRAYKRTFGRSLGDLWKDFAEEFRRSAATNGSTAARLTSHGFWVSTPRYARDGRLYYSVATPHAFPALMEIATPDEGSHSNARRVATRYLGGGTGTSPQGVVIDEIDLVQSVALRSDLWLVNPRSGHRTRLTHEARAADPDVSPDGATIVCTVQNADRRALATLPLSLAGGASPQVLIDQDGTDFAGPRWSPDGRVLAAERRTRGGPAEIVLVDRSTRQVRTIASLPGGRSGTPAWSPDGRYLFFASAVGDEPFRVFRVDVGSGAVARLEGTGTSAQAPEPSPDGTRLVYVGYTVDGYDLFSIALADARWTAIETVTLQQNAAPVAVPAAGPVAPYAPTATLMPSFWTPTLESDADELVIGAATGAVDALGRHAYAIEGGWSTRARPDWQVAYAYDRWRPTFFAAFSDDTDPWRAGELRSQEVDAGALFPVRHVRNTRTWLASLHAGRDTYDCESCDRAILATVQRTSARGGFSFTNAHEFGYSISAEEGVRVTVTSELMRGTVEDGAERLSGHGLATTADVRGYWRMTGPHDVLAVRVAAASYQGDAAAEQEFSAAGNGPQGSGFGFGSDAIGLLRGFRERDVLGRHALVVNADYRFPLWRVNRGVGTLPGFLRTIHGALFADAGHAWADTLDWSDARASFGAEISADTVLGFGLPLTFTAGAAARRDGATGRSSVAVFGRIGRAF